MATTESEVTILLLVGIPGAGKTYLSKSLLDLRKSNTEVLVISFDELIPLETQEKFALSKLSKTDDPIVKESTSSTEDLEVWDGNNKNLTWRSSRQNILMQVEKLINGLIKNEVDSEVFSYFNQEVDMKKNRFLRLCFVRGIKITMSFL